MLVLSFALSGCSSNQPPPPTTQTQNAPAIEAKHAPALIEYLQSFKPLEQEVENEFKQIQNTKGITDDIRQHHWALDEKIKKIDITGAYYPNHTELSGHVALAHKYNVYLWQAYQDNNVKEIDDTKSLIEKELSAFKKMSAKIEAGEIKDVYNGPKQ